MIGTYTTCGHQIGGDSRRREVVSKTGEKTSVCGLVQIKREKKQMLVIWSAYIGRMGVELVGACCNR